MDKDNKILITGATGLIGSYLLRKLLNDGFTEITCIKRPDSNLDLLEDVKDQVIWVDVDLLEADYIHDLTEGKEYVFHCAAIVSFDPSMSKKMNRINVEGTANIVNACLYHSVKRLIFISSVAAIGRDPKVELINEDTQWTESRLNSDYGKSKMQAELEVWRGHSEGLDVVVANPALVIGTGDWNRSSLQVFNRISKGIRFYPTGGNGIVDVRDVVEALVAMATTDRVNERYILSAENITYADFFTKLSRALNVKPPSTPLPGWLSYLAPYIEKMRSMLLSRPPVITRASLRTINYQSNYDNSKSIKTLGIQYRPISSTINSCAATYLSGESRPLSF